MWEEMAILNIFLKLCFISSMAGHDQNRRIFFVRIASLYELCGINLLLPLYGSTLDTVQTEIYDLQVSRQRRVHINNPNFYEYSLVP